MDWFQRLTGFEELSWAQTKARLSVVDGRLHSVESDRSYDVGRLELVSLADLRARVSAGQGPSGRLSVRNVSGDVRTMHLLGGYSGALFQVASQFNLLEMVSPDVTPEDGVTRYAHDHTQGPACAIAAGAGTIYRNYFAPVGDGEGQTRERQLDGLADVGAALSQALGRPVADLWTMSNGYALARAEGLAAIAAYLDGLDEAARDALRGLLRIGVQSDAEVTDRPDPGPWVSQAYCSALPVGYSGVPAEAWAPFARLVLEAAYEATLLAAVLNARRGASNIVLLTRLGGGVFGNADAWIDAAMIRALDRVRAFDLDARLVSYDAPPPSMLAIAARYGRSGP